MSVILRLDEDMGIQINYRVYGDEINDAICSSSMYIQEIAG